MHRRFPAKEPLIKVTPIIKLNGIKIVSLNIKLTLAFCELFCIPIIKSKNKEKLNVRLKNIFL